MKYYSEKLDKIFDNKNDLFNAEKAYEQEKAAFEAKEAQLKAKQEEDNKIKSKRKKELSDKIEEASKNLDEAYKFYEAEKSKVKDILTGAQKKADDIIKQARQEAQKLIDIAEKEVKKASEQKTLAISNFNKEFGPYRTVITGDKAIDEYNKLVRNFENTFSNIWKGFWDRF